MTLLTKTVRREASAQVFDRGARSIIISIEPPGLLGFRAKGTRRTYRLPASVVYRIAVDAYARALVKERKEARKARRLAKKAG
jgi:hypothetical protein